MNIFDFITQDELDDLPHDDANMAFATFVRHALRNLAAFIKEHDTDQEPDWNLIEDARQGFMNVVVAAAKRYKIEPFASMEMPRVKQFNYELHQQFRADLDHYMTQLVLDNSIRDRGNAVPLPPKSKDAIRRYIHGLKTCIDNADLTEARRASLHARLAEFESELEKKRVSLFAVTRIAFEILALPGGVWATGEMVTKLVSNVMTVVAEAKAADDAARQLPPISEPVALSPPRAPERKPAPAAFDTDLDDDVPF